MYFPIRTLYLTWKIEQRERRKCYKSALSSIPLEGIKCWFKLRLLTLQHALANQNKTVPSPPNPNQSCFGFCVFPALFGWLLMHALSAGFIFPPFFDCCILQVFSLHLLKFQTKWRQLQQSLQVSGLPQEATAPPPLQNQQARLQLLLRPVQLVQKLVKPIQQPRRQQVEVLVQRKSVLRLFMVCYHVLFVVTLRLALHVWRTELYNLSVCLESKSNFVWLKISIDGDVGISSPFASLTS